MEGLLGLENELLELSGVQGGLMWAQSGRQQRSKSLLGAVRAPKKFIGRARGRPRAIWESDNIDQGPPWGGFWPPFGGSRGAPERTF